MTTRFIGIPDSEGIIRLFCGSDVIEIEVVSGLANGVNWVAMNNYGATQPTNIDPFTTPFAGVVRGSAAPKYRDPFTTPYAGMVGEISNDRLNVLERCIIVPQTDGGRIDIPQLDTLVRQQFADPNQLNPSALVLCTATANLHDLSRFGEQVAKTMGDLPLAIDFGSPVNR